ncbi:MAG: hypothetical protein LBR26_01560 [Prevotella sp.]|nr:hypothetical protein [Prevotella sp.]
MKDEETIVRKRLKKESNIDVSNIGDIWTPPPLRCHEELLVIANGPSFLEIIDQCLNYRNNVDVYSMNSATLAEWFFVFCPDYHMICDHCDFNTSLPNGLIHKDTVERGWSMFDKVDWSLQCSVPYEYVSATKNLVDNQFIKITGCSLFELPENHPEPMKALSNGYYIIGTANSVVRSLCMALVAGYKTIWLAGADATLINSFYTDEFCRIYRQFSHSYESPQVFPDYLNLKERMRMNFNFISQLEFVKKLAEQNDVQIVNLSMKSLLDTFPKGEIGKKPLPWKPSV